jgi:hypothetical protein
VKSPFSVKQVKVEEEETAVGATTSTSSLSYKCPICYRMLPSQQRLESHVAMHTDNSFPCHICGKVLISDLYINGQNNIKNILFLKAPHLF